MFEYLQRFLKSVNDFIDFENWSKYDHFGLSGFFLFFFKGLIIKNYLKMNFYVLFNQYIANSVQRCKGQFQFEQVQILVCASNNKLKLSLNLKGVLLEVQIRFFEEFYIDEFLGFDKFLTVKRCVILRQIYKFPSNFVRIILVGSDNERSIAQIYVVGKNCPCWKKFTVYLFELLSSKLQVVLLCGLLAWLFHRQ
eukprot:TRINITY_DN14223_c1_g1_i1.p1 TRINITY_DN14223_c1_g1~~TRINITY_DN14223_c1_g1_i1.p1  ORF type:complete len:195 (-),score=12.90 TRINITY_DN14223_c1_g1_i1:230-814(-)